jgi:hypothetical protein
MAYLDGSAGTLFHVNFKINTAERGFNMKYHMNGTNYAAVMANAVALSGYLKKILPSDAAVFYATVTRDDSKRDSKFLRDALGQGEYITSAGPPPVPSLYDMPQTAVLVRLENTEGDSISRKINPIPDTVITDALVGGSVADVVTTLSAPSGAAGSGATWYLNFNLFMQAMVAYTIWVRANHSPGGDFTYAAWNAAFVLRTAVKKGGRVFTS